MNNLSEICREIQAAKAREDAAKAERQGLEAKFLSLVGVAENLEGTETVKPEGFVVKVTGRINRKIDGDLLQEIAKEAGTEEHLSSLFRWKPEINLKNWKAADKRITTPLAAAITSTPGKLSVKITPTEVV